MKIAQLFEGQLSRGHYNLGYQPTSRDRGLAHIYNNVVPALARIFKLPTVAFQMQNDYGFLWSTAKGRYATKLWSTEGGLMMVTLRRKGLDVDLISTMLPKALKNELEKQLVNVRVEVEKVTQETNVDLGGNVRFPPTVLLRFRTDYPDEWKKWDKERYRI